MNPFTQPTAPVDTEMLSVLSDVTVALSATRFLLKDDKYHEYLTELVERSLAVIAKARGAE